MLRRIQNYIIIFFALTFVILLMLNAFFASDTYRKSNVNKAFVYGENCLYNGHRVPVGKSDYKVFIQSPAKDSELVVDAECIDDKVFSFYINGEKLQSKNAAIRLPVSDDYYVVDLTIDTDSAFWINDVYVSSPNLIYYDEVYGSIILSILIILAEIIFMIQGAAEKLYAFICRKNVLICGFCILVGLSASLPSLSRYLMDGWDIPFALLRIEGVYQGLLQGKIFNRINQYYLLGSGYADPITYPGLLLYIPAVLRLARVSPVGAYNTCIVLANIATTFTAYFTAKGITKNNVGGYVGAILYTLAPYRFATNYSRYGFGEILALIFVPLVLYGLYCIFLDNNKKWYIFTIGCVGVLSSHIITTVLCAFICSIFIFCYIGRLADKRVLKSFFFSVIFMLLLSLRILLPFVQFMGEDLWLDALKGCIPSEHGISMYCFFRGFCGFESEYEKKLDTEYYITLGVAIMLASAVGIYYYIRSLHSKTAENFKNKRTDSIYSFMLVLSAVMTVICVNVFPWSLIERVPLLRGLTVIQFAWRFMGLIILFLSVVGGYGAVCLTKINKKSSLAVIAVLFTLNFVTNIPIANGIMRESSRYIENGDGVPLDCAKTRRKICFYREYMYYFTDCEELVMSAGNYTVSDKSVKVEKYIQEPYEISFSVNAPNGGYIDLPKIAYPVYEAEINGNILKPVKSDNNCLRINLPKGESEVRVYYKISALWTFTDIIFVVSAAVLIFIIISIRRGKAGGEYLDSGVTTG